VLLGSIRQEAASGELLLEQHDGVRRLLFAKGELQLLRSEAAGEQFGSYLLRQGVIDLAILRELLGNAEGFQLGEKVIQWGMMSLEERDRHLHALQEQILIHALEHRIVKGSWNPHPQDQPDPRFRLSLREFIWRTFMEADFTADLLELLRSEREWKWSGCPELPRLLEELPLDPGTARALAVLGTDAASFETLCALGRRDAADACRMVAALWALGGLARQGGLPVTLGAASAHTASPPPRPALSVPAPTPPVSAPTPALPLILPPADPSFGLPKAQVPLDPAPAELQDRLEFIESEDETQERPAPSLADLAEEWPSIGLADMPPCGPRPERRIPLADLPPLRPPVEPEEFPDDLPPCGPRPVPRSRPDDLPPCGPPLIPRIRPAELPPSGPPPEPRPEPRPPVLQPFQDTIPSSIELDPEREGVPPPPTQQAVLGQSQARALVGRARRQVMLGRTLEAIQTLEEALRLRPDDLTAYEAWLTLGRLRSPNLVWSARAIQALTNAARIRKAEADPWVALGELHRRMGDDKEAIACFRKAFELNPTVTLPRGVEVHKAPESAPRGKRR
jgi:tetratricopeptide (TPR) repeat protein